MIEKILFLLFLSSAIQAQDCLVPADPNGRDVPFSPATVSSSSFPSKTQVIVESYTLECQGDITTWWTYISTPDSTSSSSSSTSSSSPQNYTFTFQVWRKAQGYQESGCYALVGANMFDKVQVSAQGLVKAVPLEKDYITAMPGDMIGLYAQSHNSNSSSTSEDNSPRVRLDESYSHETVWFYTNVVSRPLTYGSNPCYFSAGNDSGRTLHSFTHAAPLISLNMVPQTPFPSPSVTAAWPAAVTAAVPTTIQVPVLSSTLSTQATSTTFLVPTTEGINTLSPNPKWWMWVAIGIGAAFLLLILFILLLVICVCARRKKNKQNETDENTEQGSFITPEIRSFEDESEPIYAEIDAERRGVYASINSLDIEVVGIEVVANESYAMLPSNNTTLHYGAMESESEFHRPEAERT